MEKKQITKYPDQLHGLTRQEVYSYLGEPNYLEFGGSLLGYIIKRGWLIRKKNLIINLDNKEIVESAYLVDDISEFINY